MEACAYADTAALTPPSRLIVVLSAASEPMVPSDSAPTRTYMSRPSSTSEIWTVMSSSVTEVTVSVAELELTTGLGIESRRSSPATTRVTMSAMSGRTTGCGAVSDTGTPSSKKPWPSWRTSAFGDDNEGAPVASTAGAYEAPKATSSSSRTSGFSPSVADTIRWLTPKNAGTSVWNEPSLATVTSVPSTNTCAGIA